MTASQCRWSAIGAWLSLACLAFIAIGSVTVRSWGLLLVVAVIPPLMMLWLWNEDRPVMIGSLQNRSPRR